MMLFRLAIISPFEFIVDSLLMTNTFEFSISLPFSKVIDVWMGEFCTKILVLGRLEQPCALLVTCSVIEPFEFECGTPPITLSDGSSNDVDLIPLAEVDVVTFCDDDLAVLISRCFGEFFGELSK